LFVENNASCDYLDICGEPEFMERMEVKYHKKAMETGSLVVSACGFDSVPAELGWMFNSKHWVGPAAPNQIEAYLNLESEKRIVGNFGTYESAVLGVANVEQLVELRRSRPKRARPAVRTLLFVLWFPFNESKTKVQVNPSDCEHYYKSIVVYVVCLHVTIL
jgi:short subunit dehydrogenase-like uncharacterized protein